ncbi:uncharacterized protein VTP21DRAFT_10012 [Calcarisporiella thermophila]|uniref:uncharacterized protein n=1 Tax=Calcarisporiella thermophila TaxID=911321 RepID=UPI0037448912
MFAESFWSEDDSGKVALFERIKRGKQTCDLIQSLIQTRAEIEETYAEQLLKLVRLPVSSHEWGTLRDTLNLSQASIEREAKAHLELAEQLKNNLCPRLNDVKKRQQEEYRRQQSMVDNSHQLKQLYTSAALKASEVYESECEKLKQIQRDSSRIEELKVSVLSVETAEREYRHACTMAQNMSHQWTADWAKACNSFQLLEEQRYMLLREFLTDYYKSVLSCSKESQEAIIASENALEKCNFNEDLEIFVEEKGTGKKPPDPVTFVKLLDLQDYIDKTSSLRTTTSNSTDMSSDEIAMNNSSAIPAVSDTKYPSVSIPQVEQPPSAPVTKGLTSSLPSISEEGRAKRPDSPMVTGEMEIANQQTDIHQESSPSPLPPPPPPTHQFDYMAKSRLKPSNPVRTFPSSVVVSNYTISLETAYGSSHPDAESPISLYDSKMPTEPHTLVSFTPSRNNDKPMLLCEKLSLAAADYPSPPSMESKLSPDTFTSPMPLPVPSNISALESAASCMVSVPNTAGSPNNPSGVATTTAPENETIFRRPFPPPYNPHSNAPFQTYLTSTPAPVSVNSRTSSLQPLSPNMRMNATPQHQLTPQPAPNVSTLSYSQFKQEGGLPEQSYAPHHPYPAIETHRQMDEKKERQHSLFSRPAPNHPQQPIKGLKTSINHQPQNEPKTASSSMKFLKNMFRIKQPVSDNNSKSQLESNAKRRSSLPARPGQHSEPPRYNGAMGDLEDEAVKTPSRISSLPHWRQQLPQTREETRSQLYKDSVLPHSKAAAGHPTSPTTTAKDRKPRNDRTEFPVDRPLPSMHRFPMIAPPPKTSHSLSQQMLHPTTPISPTENNYNLSVFPTMAHPSYQPLRDWDSNASYAAGERVVYHGKQYVCLRSHVARGYPPASQHTLWQPE